MAITKALMYARVSSSSSTGTGLYKKARLAATRLNFYGPKILCTVNGTVRSYNFDRTTWSVTQRRRGQPGQLAIEFFGFTPTIGHEVILGGGSLTNRLFRGKITGIGQTRIKKDTGRVVYPCTCLDWGYVVDGVRNVSAKFSSATGSAIAADLMTAYGPAGFTANHIQGGLATLDEIQFTMQSLNDALQQLCDRLGAYFYWDFDKDLHLFTTDTSGVAAETINSSNKHVRHFQHRSDIEDLRNEIFVEGKGSTVSVALAAGSETIPLEDVSMFDTSGGMAKLEAQVITYDGVAGEDGGSVVLGLTQEPTAPDAEVADGESGQVIGVVSYKVAHRLPGGDSEVSDASDDVEVETVDAPGSAPSISVSTSTDGGVTPGGRKWKVTYVTDEGETLGGTASSTATITAVSAPGSAPSISPTTGGSVPSNSSFYVGISFVTAAGETLASVLGTVSTGVSDNRLSWSSIPTSADGRVTARKLYRTPSTNFNPSGLKLLTTISDNSTTTYTDNSANGSLGANAPTADTTGGQYALTSIPTSSDARVSQRKLYRTAAGGAVYKLLTTIADNSTTIFTDTVPDSSLGDPEPTADTSGGGQVDVTIPVGPAGTTARRIYRTEDGGDVWKYLGSVNDNSTTTYRDNKADANLGDDAPDDSMVRTEAGSTFLRVADLGEFPSDGGWVRVDGQVLYYGARGLSGIGFLTDIPASGVGSIQAPISAGATLLNQPHLTGIPDSGNGALQYAVTPGDTVNLLVQDDDTASQASYGVRMLFVQDRRTVDGAVTRAAAELALRKDPRVSGTFESSDPKLHAGAPVTLDHWGISATVVVEQVTIGPRPDRPQPMLAVQFASRSIEDLYAALREMKDRLNR